MQTLTAAPVLLDSPLTPQQVWQVAQGASLHISPAARARVGAAHALVAQVVASGDRVYGVSTGVGMLSDMAVSPHLQQQLSRNLVFSHAVGVGEALSEVEVRAIMVCAIGNHCHGYSGIRWEVVQGMLALLEANILPVVPRQGSVGYVSHMAHVALVLIGHGWASMQGRRVSGAQALAAAGLTPLELQAKEGLSLISGAPCAAGLACVAVGQARELLEWSHATAALSFEALGGQVSGFDAAALALRPSPGLAQVGRILSHWLEDSPSLAEVAGCRTQDAPSLRAIPQVHGAVVDVLAHVEAVVQQELASATDNPLLVEQDGQPHVLAVAHGVASGLGLAMDYLATAVAQLGGMSERRLDRMLNPLVSGLPPFLADQGGVSSGFMIAQYTALSLCNENRRLAAPAALDGGITSGLQEDMLCHATPAALKCVHIVANTCRIIGTEMLAALQVSEYATHAGAPRTTALRQALRRQFAPFHDERPLGEDLEAMALHMALPLERYWQQAQSAREDAPAALAAR